MTSHEPVPTVRILAFSDLHRDVEAADAIVRASGQADVVVGAGDFATRGEGGPQLLDRFAALACTLVLVAGNHDRKRELAAFCADRAGIHLLDGSIVEVASLVFFGLGGEIPRRSDAPWNETMKEDEAQAILAAAPDFDVLVSHTPPHGFCDAQADGRREGSVAVAEGLAARRPALCLCGHIHHSWGRIERVGPTTIHNLGPVPSRHALPRRS